METPIINPWFFYIAGTVNGVKIMCLFFGLIITIACAILYKFEYGSFKNVIMGVVLLLLGVFTPSASICYQMLAASMVTPRNIELVGDTTEKAVDILIDKIIKASKELDKCQQ